MRFPLHTNQIWQKVGASERTWIAFLDLGSFIFLKCIHDKVMQSHTDTTQHKKKQIHVRKLNNYEANERYITSCHHLANNKAD